MTCIELDWFERLRDGPLTMAQLAHCSELGEAATRRLGLAAASLSLLERRGSDALALGPLGAAMIGDAGIAAMATHHRLFYADMADPLALLRGDADTRLGDYWGYASSDDPAMLSAERVRDYSRLMADSQPMIAEQVLAVWRFDRYRHHLDIGGGTGAFVNAVHAVSPKLQQTLLDLPGVVAQAPARDGLTLIGGNFLDATLPRDADLITLVRIVHDHNDDTVLGLLRNIRRQCAANATLLIAEPMAGVAGAEAVGDAYFGFYLLAMGSGRARNQAEIDTLLVAAGFAPSRAIATPVPLVCSVLTTNPV